MGTDVRIGNQQMTGGELAADLSVGFAELHPVDVDGPTVVRVRLREAGATDADLERIMAPIGLDLGGRTPEETAISICAEIIACQTGRAVPRLRDTDGPIHGVRP